MLKQGRQYTSGKVMTLLEKSGLRQSFALVGMPGDNAWSESFFANLKKEAVHWVHFATRQKVRQAMFEYIDGFYNTKRVQKRLGYPALYSGSIYGIHNYIRESLNFLSEKRLTTQRHMHAAPVNLESCLRAATSARS